MIERVYLDNVRSFVNFEWRPERFALLLGPNGAGKTALFETLATLQAFIGGQLSVHGAFPDASRTRWGMRTEQTVELDVRIKGESYRYRLVVKHSADEPVVEIETLQHGDQNVVEFQGGELRIFRGGKMTSLPDTRLTRSGVGAIQAGTGDVLRSFQDWMGSISLFRPDPRAMSFRTENPWGPLGLSLESNLSNFASWCPRMFAAKPGSMFKALKALAELFPGFLEFRESGGMLDAVFESEGGKTTRYSFEELSDGERALSALYVVLHVVAGPGKVLLFDEPDNYLGLREIQPWLAELVDQSLRSDGPQVLLISHNPEALNFLAAEKGWRMHRDGNGPTRIDKFQPSENLDPAETVARGWDDKP